MRDWWKARSNRQKAFLIIGGVVFLGIATSSDPDDGSAVTTTTTTTARASETLAPTTTSTQGASTTTTTTQRVSTTTRAPATSGYSDSDVEYQLAVIDAGGFVRTDDPVIDLYDHVLDQLSSKCGDTRRMLGDMAVRATQLLADEGVFATALEMLEGAEIATADLDKQDSCASVFAVMMVLMTE